MIRSSYRSQQSQRSNMSLAHPPHTPSKRIVIRLEKNCHPDRSAAQWRDLLSASSIQKSGLSKEHCHPDRSGGTCCSLVLSRNLGYPKNTVIPIEAEGPAVRLAHSYETGPEGHYASPLQHPVTHP
jgi:hypothetical protein